MTRVFVGIGSNSGDRQANLRRAITELPGVVAVSPFYETEAVGDKHGSDHHLNAVLELTTELDPRRLLDLALAIERDTGRDRTLANVPVTLDIDILLFGDEMIDDEVLQLPHPRMWQRRFVLAPLADIAPELVTPQQLARAEGAVTRTTSL